MCNFSLFKIYVTIYVTPGSVFAPGDLVLSPKCGTMWPVLVNDCLWIINAKP